MDQVDSIHKVNMNKLEAHSKRTLDGFRVSSCFKLLLL